LKTNHIEQRIVSHIDLLPTLMDLCGLAVPPIMDGHSFAELMKPGMSRSDLPARAIVEFNRFQLERDDFGAFYPIRCIVEGYHKLVINLFDLDELYDLERDPLERTNLIRDPSYETIRDRLHAELLDWMYVRRDAFRSPQWERRSWSASRRFALCRGKIRTTRADGLRPEARGYLTALPIEYDFEL
jgi:arylsulfatase A-like enzyme